MDEICEKVQEFINESANPNETAIQSFLIRLALDNPTLEIENFRVKLFKHIKQAQEFTAIEGQLSTLGGDKEKYSKLETILKKAKEMHCNMEDISNELSASKEILISINEGKKVEKTADVEIKKEITASVEGREDKVNPHKHSKKEKYIEKKKRKQKREKKEEPQPLDIDKKHEIVPPVVLEPEPQIKKEEKTEEKISDNREEKVLTDAEKDINQVKTAPSTFTGKISTYLLGKKEDKKENKKSDTREEKLLIDVEKDINQVKTAPSNISPEKTSISFLGKLKSYFTKEALDMETYRQELHGPLVTFEGLSGYDEVERYWVNEPYAFVVILFSLEKNANLYYVVEPKLSDFEDLFLREIKDRLKDVLLFEDIKREEDKDKILTNKVRRIVKDYALDLTPLTIEKILYYTRRDFIKFGKIDPLMHDNRIEDVSANGFGVPIYLYHKKYTNLATSVIYNENELDSYVIRLAQRCGKHISVAEPMIDATMPDGSRIQMTLGKEVTTHGATFTIRKFSEVPITPVDLINWNTFSAEEMAYLWLCIENNKSLIYAGGTASGKTSSLNAVSLFIPWQAKIITLEDTRELKLPHPNWIPGVTRDSFTADGRGSIDMYDLLKAALRQRPEYLLVGEVRGKEALTLFQAMSTGHTTFSTMHADSVASAIHRLENPPISVPRTMIQALNIISIQSQTYVKGKRARRNMKLVEITDIDPTTRNIRTNDIFAWDPLTDEFRRVGESKALNDIMIRRGWNFGDLKTELVNRQKVLEFMVNNKITDFNAIATIIHDYQVTPDKVLKKFMIT